VLARREAEQGVAAVVRRGGGEEDGLDPGVLEHLLEGGVALRAAVRALQRREPLGPQLGHGLDDAVRVLVELKRQSEPAADDADPDLAGHRGGGHVRAEESGGGGDDGGSAEETAAREGGARGAAHASHSLHQGCAFQPDMLSESA